MVEINEEEMEEGKKIFHCGEEPGVLICLRI